MTLRVLGLLIGINLIIGQTTKAIASGLFNLDQLKDKSTSAWANKVCQLVCHRRATMYTLVLPV